MARRSDTHGCIRGPQTIRELHRYSSPGADPAFDITLREQLIESRTYSVAGDPKLVGESPRRGQARAGLQPPVKNQTGEPGVKLLVQRCIAGAIQ